jgi:peptidoglycan/LPS O-acetylase OafA/YrhL
MSPTSFLPVFAIVAIALASSFVMMRALGPPATQGRFTSIDGLRGFSALFVFIHHSCIWFFYLRTGQWAAPPSNLFNSLGQASVIVFFMITAFLFFNKIAKEKNGIDWGKLLVGRFTRLAPLYFFSLALLLIIVAYKSSLLLNEAPISIIKEVFTWSIFTFAGEPNINGLHNTYLIDAGVTWSLPYEWFFYLLLPFIGILIGIKARKSVIAFVGSLAVVALLVWKPHTRTLIPFFLGISACFFATSERVQSIATNGYCSLLVMICLVTAYTCFESAYSLLCLCLLAIAFIFIAAGNTLFGILTGAVSRTLGEFAYGIYLLHGIMLYTLFSIVIGERQSSQLAPTSHWLLIIAVTPLLIGTTALTFKFIEQPWMLKTARITNWLRHSTGRGKKTSGTRDYQENRAP